MFDTVTLRVTGRAQEVVDAFAEEQINLRPVDGDVVSISLNETTTTQDLQELVDIFARLKKAKTVKVKLGSQGKLDAPRENPEFMQQRVFNTYRSETQMMRYIHQLVDKDVGLTKSMIPLGSCTMKLNAAIEMIPVSWPQFSEMHPFAPQS